MIIVMEENATEEQIVRVVDRLVNLGYDIHRSTGARYTILGAVGSRITDPGSLELLDGVNKVYRVSSPYKLAARAFKPEGTRFSVGDVVIGGDALVVMAGPPIVESREQMEVIAETLASQGVRVLRSGAMRVGLDPYGFQGLGEEGLKLLREMAERHGMVTLTEVSDVSQIPVVARYADMIQVGGRNMANFALLREVARVGKPVIVNRGSSSTIEEALQSADYVMISGNHNVAICESGIRTIETYTRRTLDLSAIPAIRKLSHLPVIVDPSEAAGRRDRVLPLARASVAAGADGLIVDVHPDPDRALCDGAQSISVELFHQLACQLQMIAPAVGRKF